MTNYILKDSNYSSLNRKLIACRKIQYNELIKAFKYRRSGQFIYKLINSFIEQLHAYPFSDLIRINVKVAFIFVFVWKFQLLWIKFYKEKLEEKVCTFTLRGARSQAYPHFVIFFAFPETIYVLTLSLLACYQ